jgi:DNA-binding winged helix-turn-helix (wHTH) protein
MDALRQRRRSTLLTPADLATVPEFRLGDALVNPSRRQLSGPGGTVALEPRVMQVLVVLSEQAGRVVSRETLFERCWGDVYVGDDSLNRVVGSLRKISSDIAADSFTIETITRTGYRLVGEVVQAKPSDSSPQAIGFTRRELASAAIGVAALGAIGARAFANSRREERFEQLLLQTKGLIDGDGNEFKPEEALRAADAAVRLHPDDPRALGWLALIRSYFAQIAPPDRSAAAATLTMQTAQKALAIDPKEPNALLALFEVQGSTLDWLARDQLLRRIVSIDPANGLAMAELASVLQAAGLCREAWDWNERLLRQTPLSSILLTRRAQKLWIFGRFADADNVMNQLRAQFPKDGWVWLNRFQIYAFTGRAGAARAMLENDPAMIASGPATQMWRDCLDALERPSAVTIAKARHTCLAAVPASGELAGAAVMAMSALGDVDTAFQIADGYLLGRGRVLLSSRAGYGPAPGDALHRIDTYPLFMPPCRAMRRDGRFTPLCEGVGLVEYWRRRRVEPDYLLLDGRV